MLAVYFAAGDSLFLVVGIFAMATGQGFDFFAATG